MCRQKLRNEVPAARNLALSCRPIRACKVQSLLRFFTISPNKQRSFLATSIASSVRHQRGNDLHSPGGVHAFLRVQHHGCRMLFIRFVNRAVQTVRRSHPEGRSRQEIADIPRFAAPPGDAHRARGSRYRLLFNGPAAVPTVDRSSSLAQLITAPVSVSAAASPWRRSRL